MKDHRWLVATAIAVAVFSVCGIALAHVPPINTDTPIMLGLQGRGTRTFVKVVRRARLLENGQEVDDPLDRSVTAPVLPVAVPYNVLSDKLQVGFVAPFMNVDLSTTESTMSNSGIGDVLLFTKYSLYQRDGLNETFRIASKAGVKLPTGDEDGSPTLGTGSTDYFFTTVAGWIRRRVGSYAEGIYNLNTSRAEVDFGDSVSYNVALGYRLAPEPQRDSRASRYGAPRGRRPVPARSCGSPLVGLLMLLR